MPPEHSPGVLVDMIKVTCYVISKATQNTYMTFLTVDMSRMSVGRSFMIIDICFYGDWFVCDDIHLKVVQ